MLIGKSRELLLGRFNEMVFELYNFVEEIDQLPKGTVVKRKYQGKETYQLSYREGKKVKTKYLKASEVEGIRTDIARRHSLEAQKKILKKELKGVSKILKITSINE